VGGADALGAIDPDTQGISRAQDITIGAADLQTMAKNQPHAEKKEQVASH
jgi:hypothetical protein